MHQPQRFVVHQDNFYIQLIFGGGGHLLNIHHQAAVTGETNNLTLRIRQRRADGRRQAEAHGAETAGSQPLARTVERIGLRRPHLMLTHIGGDDRLIINAGGHGVNQAVMGERIAFLRDGTGEFSL